MIIFILSILVISARFIPIYMMICGACGSVCDRVRQGATVCDRVRLLGTLVYLNNKSLTIQKLGFGHDMPFDEIFYSF